MPFREYAAFEHNAYPIPKDGHVPGEWVFGRLMYPTIPGYQLPDWRFGYNY